MFGVLEPLDSVKIVILLISISIKYIYFIYQIERKTCDLKIWFRSLQAPVTVAL